MGRPPVNLGEDRHLLPVVGPVVARPAATRTDRHRAGPVLVALGADVFCRVTGTDDEDVLTGELLGVPEVVGVQDPPEEGLEPREVGHVGHREVAAGHHHVVELLRGDPVFGQVVAGHREHVRTAVEGDLPDDCPEPDEVAHATLLDPALDVVPEDLPRRIGGDGFSEVLLERVVGELQAFLRTVRPEVAVHGAVHRFAILI